MKYLRLNLLVYFGNAKKPAPLSVTFKNTGDVLVTPDRCVGLADLAAISMHWRGMNTIKEWRSLFAQSDLDSGFFAVEKLVQESGSAGDMYRDLLRLEMEINFQDLDFPVSEESIKATLWGGCNPVILYDRKDLQKILLPEKILRPLEQFLDALPTSPIHNHTAIVEAPVSSPAPELPAPTAGPFGGGPILEPA